MTAFEMHAMIRLLIPEVIGIQSHFSDFSVLYTHVWLRTLRKCLLENTKHFTKHLYIIFEHFVWIFSVKTMVWRFLWLISAHCHRLKSMFFSSVIVIKPLSWISFFHSNTFGKIDQQDNSLTITIEVLTHW